MVGVADPSGAHYPSDILGNGATGQRGNGATGQRGRWAAGLAWVVGLYLVLFRQRLPWPRRRGNEAAA